MEAYSSVLNSGCPKALLADLEASVHREGLAGDDGLALAQAAMGSFAPTALSSAMMYTMYRFCFFISREQGRKFLPKEQAIKGWKAVLEGKFRRLHAWCTFVANHSVCIITEDTWCQVFEFSRTIYEDLSNYDTHGAWPTLIDDFVMHVRRRHASIDVDASDLSPATLTRAGIIPLTIPASSGSKRQLPMADEEADAERLAHELSALRSSSADLGDPCFTPCQVQPVNISPVKRCRRGVAEEARALCDLVPMAVDHSEQLQACSRLQAGQALWPG